MNISWTYHHSKEDGVLVVVNYRMKNKPKEVFGYGYFKI